MSLQYPLLHSKKCVLLSVYSVKCTVLGTKYTSYKLESTA